MATLTCSDFTRSTVILPASRPRLSMPLSAASGMIMAARRSSAASARQAGSRHGVRSDLLINDKSITTTAIDIAAQSGSYKPCGDVDDQGARADFGNTTGAFVTSLGDRPPSPPV